MFDCQQVCRRSGTAELDDGARAEKNCTLPGFPSSRWRGSKREELIEIHMGLPRRWDLDGQDKDFMAPLEPILEEGCPGGWYRSVFVGSLHKYRRRSAGEGGRVENLLLSRCDDRLVLAAIAYLEDEEAHALGAFYEARDADG